MGIDALKSAIPDYAKDLRVNLGVLSTSSLAPEAAWGAALTAALVAKQPTVIEAILEEAQAHLSAEQVEGCKSAAAIMSMNNVWYKFGDLVADDELKGQPPKLRMNAMVSNGGVGPVLFETWSLSASVVNACGTCVNAHVAQLRNHEVSTQNLVDVGRIAAVVKAVSDTLSFDAAL